MTAGRRRCAICGEVAVIHDGVVGLDLCESDECGDTAWEDAFRLPQGPTPTPSQHALKAALHEAWMHGTEQMPCPCESLARKVTSHVGSDA